MLTKALPVKDFVAARDKFLIPTILKVTSVSLIATLLIASTSAVRFDTVRPIVYERTVHFVDVGEHDYTIDLTFTNPCKLLDRFLPKEPTPLPPTATISPMPVAEIDHTQRNYVKSYINDCNNFYDSTWKLKVEDLLKTQIPRAVIDPIDLEIHNLAKRGVIELTILGMVVTNFLSSIFTPIATWSEYSKITGLQKFPEHEASILKQFETDFNTTKAIQRGLLTLCS